MVVMFSAMTTRVKAQTKVRSLILSITLSCRNSYEKIAVPHKSLYTHTLHPHTYLHSHTHTHTQAHTNIATLVSTFMHTHSHTCPNTKNMSSHTHQKNSTGTFTCTQLWSLTRFHSLKHTGTHTIISLAHRKAYLFQEEHFDPVHYFILFFLSNTDKNTRNTNISKCAVNP